FDKFGGVCKEVPSSKLAEWVIRELVRRTAVATDEINDVNLGLCMFAEAVTQTDIIARQALLRAGLRDDTLSNNIDRACCSSTTALQQSMRNLKLGEANVSIALGVDNMSRVTLYVPPEYRWNGTRLGDLKLVDMLFNFGVPGFGVLAVDAGEVALEHGVSREMQDEWAARSQAQYAQAEEKGYLKNEIFPVEIPQDKKNPPLVFDRDANPRPGTSVEKLAKLPTIYGSPTMTAGNSPGLGAGASGIMLTTRAKADALGVKPVATLVDVVSIATKPREIAVAPAVAIKKALDKTGLKLHDFKTIEINEAFAAMPLVSTKILGEGDDGLTQKLRDITNVDGGAIAIGHPVGASGLRIAMHAVEVLKRKGGGYALATICGGLAQGDAVVLKIDDE
ncbi:MAG: thiolase family protein, partial [Gracilibacteraceae bacterium]|nr:thiolase family protein [Gracilibacteraceae bacterium]